MRDPSEVIAGWTVERMPWGHINFKGPERIGGAYSVFMPPDSVVLAEIALYEIGSAILSTPQPAAADVDDAMVERACAAIDAFNRRDCADKTPNDSWVSRPIVRAELLAAINGECNA